MTGSTSTGTLNLDISGEDIFIGPDTTSESNYFEKDRGLNNFRLDLFSGDANYAKYIGDASDWSETSDGSNIQITNEQVDIVNAGIKISHSDFSFIEIVFNVPDTYTGEFHLKYTLADTTQQVLINTTGLLDADASNDQTLTNGVRISYVDLNDGFKEMHIKSEKINNGDNSIIPIDDLTIYVTELFTIKNVHIHYSIPANVLDLNVENGDPDYDTNTLTVDYTVNTDRIGLNYLGGFQIKLDTVEDVTITGVSLNLNFNNIQISDDNSTIIWSRVYSDSDGIIQNKNWDDTAVSYHFQVVYNISGLNENGDHAFVTTTLTSFVNEFSDTYYTYEPTNEEHIITINRARIIQLIISNTSDFNNIDTLIENLNIEGYDVDENEFTVEVRNFDYSLLELEFDSAVSKIYISDINPTDGTFDFDTNEIKMMTNHILNNSEITDISLFDFNNDNNLDIADLLNLYNKAHEVSHQIQIYINGNDAPHNELNLEDGVNTYDLMFLKKGVLPDNVSYNDNYYVTGAPASTSDTLDGYDIEPAPAPDGDGYDDVTDTFVSGDQSNVDPGISISDGTTVPGTGYQKFTDSSTGTDTYILGQDSIDSFTASGQHIYISKVEVLNSTSECKLYFSVSNDGVTDGIGFQVMIPKLPDAGNDAIFLGGTNYIEGTNSSPPGLLGTTEYPLTVTDQDNPNQIISNFLWKSETNTTWLSSRELASMSFTYPNVDTTLGSFEVDLFKIYPTNNIYLHEVRINFDNKLINDIILL